MPLCWKNLALARVITQRIEVLDVCETSNSVNMKRGQHLYTRLMQRLSHTVSFSESQRFIKIYRNLKQRRTTEDQNIYGIYKRVNS